MKKKLLIIEDEPSVAKQIRWGLMDAPYDITIAGDATQAKPLLASGAFPVATLDLGLPPHPDTPRQGFELLEAATSLAPHTRIIVITGNAEEKNAVKAIALGAADFCAKPIDLKLLRIILARTFKLQSLEAANRELRKQRTQGGSLCGMLGVSPAMTRVFEQIKNASRTDYPVLITGNTGTGKEMVAHAVHQLSHRADQAMVIINCGAIPENLLESELFGHEKGAFTGAVRRQIGKFEQADQGTIFLDEIGELPLPLQVKILRVLQESAIDRLGGKKTVNLNVRIIAATHTNLEDDIKQGRFREDLFYRLNVVPLKIPDLTARREDILLLAFHFLQTESQNLRRKPATFSPAAIDALTTHAWPGNVRELENRIRRALGSTMDKIIIPGDLGLGENTATPPGPKLTTLKKARERAEKDVIRRALILSGNNISQAARLLETSRPTLHDLLKKHAINPN